MNNKFDFLGELQALCAKLQLNKEVAPFDEELEQITNDLQRVREIKDDAIFDSAYWAVRADYDAFAKLRKNHAEHIIRELERIKKAVATAYDSEQNELMDLNNSFWSGKQPAP